MAAPASGRKLRVRNPSRAAETERMGGRLLADYQSYQLYEVDDGVAAEAARDGEIELLDEYRFVLLNAGAIDTSSLNARAQRSLGGRALRGQAQSPRAARGADATGLVRRDRGHGRRGGLRRATEALPREDRRFPARSPSPHRAVAVESSPQPWTSRTTAWTLEPLASTSISGSRFPQQIADLNGGNPNGTWALFVIDDFYLDGGSIADGWSLTVTTSTHVCCTGGPAVVVSPASGLVTTGAGGTAAFTVALTTLPTRRQPD